MIRISYVVQGFAVACGALFGARPAVGQWVVAPTHVRASFRGLSVAPDGTVWVGGTGGIVLRTRDHGATWVADTVSGAGSFDFRGVAAIDSSTAYAMVAGTDTARIYKTTDGGVTWVLQFRDERPGAFLDGIGCWDARRCLAAGDPIDGRFVVVTTTDAGAHWNQLAATAAPSAFPGEGAFAASNTSVVIGALGRAWIATGGGSVARVWRSTDYGATWSVAQVPAVIAGAPSAGIFALVMEGDRGVAVGGDYRTPGATGAHVAVTSDGGATWSAGDTAHVAPYLSGLSVAPTRDSHMVVAVGPAGTFGSDGDWRTWTRLAEVGFNAVAYDGRDLVAVGADGLVACARVGDFEAKLKKY